MAGYQITGPVHLSAKENGIFVRTRFDLNRLMLNTIDCGLAVGLREAHGINVAIEPILMQILRTLEDCYRVGRKLTCAASSLMTDRPAANGDDRQKQHKPGANDSANA